ncbi:MAG: sigma-54 dependent transcriptional regulator [Holosporaceae bacterium]|jgi:two-component system nitrogen regulation response regulator NtrX|nr:sigma-54 dependent transcriptional regulator [Holosporaceae bacterium]
MSGERILIVDDEDEVRSLVSDVLMDEGYCTDLAKDEQEAFSHIRKACPDLIFLDLWIGEDESAGLKILKKIKKMRVEIPVIVISGHGTIDIAVQIIQKGAVDFIEKPFVIDRLLLTCRRALELHRLKMENTVLKQSKFDTEVFSIGKSTFAQSIMSTLEKIASTNSRVFIKSKVGLGADALAFKIHKKSSRSEAPFVRVNCFLDEREDLEARLFGTEQFYGYIERADDGTIFLEEIMKLSRCCQMRLLQFLQDGFYIAGNRRVRSDVRIICNSSDDVESLILLSKFHKELFYRLNVIDLDVPCLEERHEDILPLINYYMSNSEALFGLKPKKFTEMALAVLQSYSWPGNIYQVRNVVESSLISSMKSPQIDKDSLPSELTASTEEKFVSLDVAKLVSLQMKEAKEYFESDYLRAQIDRFSGNISKTAEFIGMERSALHRKLKALGIMPSKRAERR